MDYGTLKVEHDGRIGRIIIDRPEKHNSFPISTVHEFPAAIDELDEDDDVRVVILKGAAKSLSSGFDTASQGDGAQESERSSKAPMGRLWGDAAQDTSADDRG